MKEVSEEKKERKKEMSEQCYQAEGRTRGGGPICLARFFLSRIDSVQFLLVDLELS